MEFTSILTKPFATLAAFDKLTVIAFYLTIVLAVIVVAVAVIINKTAKEKLAAYGKGVKSFTLGYAVAFSIMMISLVVSDSIATESFQPTIFWPIISILIVAAVAAVVGYILSISKPQFLPKYKFIALGVTLIPVIVSIVMLALYYKTVADYYEGASQAGLYVSAVILVLVLVFGSMFVAKRKDKQLSTKELAYAAITVALSFALSYIRFMKLPQGGSVTLASMLPLMLFSYMFGIRKGIVVGVVYGVLQAVQDPWIIHPAQFFLDYPIAFGMIGFAGLFRELGFFKTKPVFAFATGAVIAAVLRYLCHVMSGIFAFATYGAAAGYSAVAWGFLYNSFALVDAAICIVVGIVMFGSKAFVRLVNEKSTTELPSVDTPKE